MGQEKLFEEYFNAIFENSNTFTAKEYKQHFMKYELNCSMHLPSNRDVRILDIGCGTGHFLYFLKKKRYKNFLGIDISPQQVDFCKKSISQQVEVADAFEFLKGKDNYYDVIVALVGLIHFFLRKLFWYQGFVAPGILTSLLLGVAKK